jgi:hypothetical protein
VIELCNARKLEFVVLPELWQGPVEHLHKHPPVVRRPHQGDELGDVLAESGVSHVLGEALVQLVAQAPVVVSWRYSLEVLENARCETSIYEIVRELSDEGRARRAVPFCWREGFDGLRAWLAERDIEGLVFHHSDGRMAKIRKADFGLARPTPDTGGET